ncbi:MAG: putative DNA binding domain-containing protein [Desulfovibrio sp.]|nr:putative DNA binding domain-containing protein [Desulfovibrio sp.]
MHSEGGSPAPRCGTNLRIVLHKTDFSLNENDIRCEVALGEDSSRQFKEDIRNAESLAAEMVAFANASGGIIYIGVADDGSVKGLDFADVSRVHQLIGHAASQLVGSPLTVRTENVPLDTGRVVIVLTVPNGLDKPYFDKNGVIWFKTGTDKRRINSKEELRRLFQITGQFFSDELPTKASLDALDRLRFRDFLKKTYQIDMPETRLNLSRLLENLNLAMHDGCLNLAGVLLFAEHPEWLAPQFIVKAIRYPANTIHATRYIDTEDFC